MTADYRRAWKHHRGDTETYQIFYLDTFCSCCLGSLSQLLSKEEELQLLPTKVRVSSDTLAQLCSVTQGPRFGGPPLCSRARHMDWCWKCNWSTQPAEHSRQQGTATALQHHRWGTDNVCHFSLTISTLTHLFRTQQQLFQITIVSTPVEQKSPPTLYRRTKDTQAFLPNWTACQKLKRHLYELTHYCYKLAKYNKSSAYIWCYTVSWVRQEKNKTMLHPL